MISFLALFSSPLISYKYLCSLWYWMSTRRHLHFLLAHHVKIPCSREISRILFPPQFSVSQEENFLYFSSIWLLRWCQQRDEKNVCAGACHLLLFATPLPSLEQPKSDSGGTQTMLTLSYSPAPWLKSLLHEQGHSRTSTPAEPDLTKRTDQQPTESQGIINVCCFGDHFYGPKIPTDAHNSEEYHFPGLVLWIL